MAKIFNQNKGGEIIPRALLFDNSLSDRARFVYCFMCGKPEGWDFYLAPMAKELGYSVDTLRKYLKELTDSGWIEKGSQNHDEETNKFGCVDYTINSKPYRKKPDTEKTRHGKIPTQDNNSTILNSSINKDNKEEKSTIVDEKNPPVQTELFNDEEKKFVTFMREKFPRIMKMQKPLTLEQAKKLKEEYGDDLLYQVMQDADNYRPLLQKYMSANLVIRKWCSRERAKA